MNITAVKNFKELNIGVRLLLTLISISDSEGRIRTNKTDLAKAVNSSRQTVGEYINSFARTNILKFKYSGSARLNPDFYFRGDPLRKPLVISEYQQFKSDVN